LEVLNQSLNASRKLANAFRNAVSLLGRSGVSIKAIDIAQMLKKLDEAGDIEMFYEGARYHEPRLKEYGSRLDQPLADLIREGLKISPETLQRGQANDLRWQSPNGGAFQVHARDPHACRDGTGALGLIHDW